MLALLVGAVVHRSLTSPLITGSLDFALPLEAYAALIEGACCRRTARSTRSCAATPLHPRGPVGRAGFKAGLFNIGAQGQFLMGALGPRRRRRVARRAPPVVAIPRRSSPALAAGAAYGFIPGWLKAFTGAHEVVTTIMLNYIAIQIVAWAGHRAVARTRRVVRPNRPTSATPASRRSSAPPATSSTPVS